MEDAKRAIDDLRLKTAAYAIEATNDERHLLWLHHSGAARERGWGTGRERWEGQGGYGWMVHVGDVAGFPVTLSLTFDTINGQSVVFWTDESRVVDHEMLREWMTANVPAFRDGRRCNTANFGHCLAHLKRTPAETSKP